MARFLRVLLSLAAGCGLILVIWLLPGPLQFLDVASHWQPPARAAALVVITALAGWLIATGIMNLVRKG